jgi:hypothetical protein
LLCHKKACCQFVAASSHNQKYITQTFLPLEVLAGNKIVFFEFRKRPPV